MDPKLEMTRQWLMLADDDLRLARFILDGDDPIYWAAAFHSQQCAEKALKGFLTFHDIRAKKSHEIDYLLELCCLVNPDFEQFKQTAGELTEYAVDSRYPAPHHYAGDKDAKQAIEIARSIYEFVLKSLPDLEKLPQE
ncbi:hypothetical protein ES703_31908 [subsurface metagenome]